MDKDNIGFSNIIKKEVEYFRHHINHPANHDIDVVWVFSGTGTIFRSLKKNDKFWSKWMDRHRILYGILLVKRITAKRINKMPQDVSRKDIEKYGPLFVYNGIPDENEAFIKFLSLHKSLMPENKVRIIDHVHVDNLIQPIENTLDQVLSFKEEYLKIQKPNCIAIVSHESHFPRILRYFSKHSLFPKDIKIEIFALKTPKKNLEKYEEEEIEKVWKYFKRGDLSLIPYTSFST